MRERGTLVRVDVHACAAGRLHAGFEETLADAAVRGLRADVVAPEVDVEQHVRGWACGACSNVGAS